MARVRITRKNLFTGIKSNRFPSKEGRKYVLSGWVFTDGNAKDDFLMIVACVAEKDTNLGPFAAATVDFPFWTKISCEVTTPADISTIDVQFQMRSKQGRIWLDDVSLKDESCVELLQNRSFEDKK
jgi:hypothetical protein